jgi:hypothetical protein
LFLAFRNHYVFESRYCNPASGHEKGGVENDVGYARRNFLAGCPTFADYDELNTYLLAQCQQADERTVHGQPQPVCAAWRLEQTHIRALPAHDFACCASHELNVNKYSQVQFETNRYSVPTDQAYRTVTLRAYPFRIEILYHDQVLATHGRSYAREQDILDPLHYLQLLAQRPGAFEHAIPLRRWRAQWPAVYERLLQQLRALWPDGRGLREFLAILKLHRDHPAELVEQAIQAALALGAAHLDGIELCLRQLEAPQEPPVALDMSGYPGLQGIGAQPVDLRQYDQLLALANAR